MLSGRAVQQKARGTMLKVAITGNIASGKSTVENLFKAKCYQVIDADIIVHELLKTKEVQEKILAEFSEHDIIENNEISRPKLGKIVFENEDLRKKLENIIHPLVKDKLESFFQNLESEKVTIASIPLLFEAKLENLFDKIILVYADDDIRLKRLMQRNNLTLEEAKKRLNSQISQDKKISLADYVIYNNKTIEDLNSTVDSIEKQLLV